MLHFGKYKGQQIEDVPLSYVQWLAENGDQVIRDNANNEWKRRISQGITSKLSRLEWSEQMSLLINKMPDGLKDQTVTYNGWEIKLRKL